MMEGTPSGRRATEFQRVYKACVSCRRKKTRCVLDAAAGRDGGPCERCKRERRSCVFSADRSHRSKSEKHPRSQSIEQDASSIQVATVADGEPLMDSTAAMDDLTFVQSQQQQSDNNRSTRRDSRYQPPIVSDSYAKSDTLAGDRDGLQDTVMRTFVSNENQALDLLFCAAQQRDAESPQQNALASHTSQRAHEFVTPVTMASIGTDSVPRSTEPSDVHRVWDSFRFVKMGWFTSEEAVMYMDLFFKNLAPVSPVCHEWDSSHSNHYTLITQEPLLVCTILMVSTRYHVLPGAGGVSRSTIVHQRLWEHCQHLIMRIIFGQEKKSKAKTRTMGAVEALLLIIEWQPKAIHFPPATDGWDSDLLLSIQDQRDDPYSNQADLPGTRWMADIVEPARMSDRMSWMLLGCAQSLAHELGLYDFSNSGYQPTSQLQPPIQRSRRLRVAKLLFIFTEQLSSRLGCTSLVPSTLGRALREHPSDTPDSAFMSAWVELTNLLRTIRDVLFPSTSGVQELLLSIRYINIIKHFQEQLATWKNAHLKTDKLPWDAFQELNIEFNNIIIFMNSLGMQAVVDRVLQEGKVTNRRSDALKASLTPTDYEFIQEVIDGCCQILQSVNKLAEEGTLRFRPVRIFHRIVAASIFLLKALSLGSHSSNLQASLATLEQTVQALHTSNFDDMHLASRYASMLEGHLARFRECLVPSTAPRGIPASIDWNSNLWNESTDISTVGNPPPAVTEDFPTGVDDWMSLPFDASLAPFGFTGDTFEMTEFDDKAWEFLRDWPMN